MLTDDFNSLGDRLLESHLGLADIRFDSIHEWKTQLVHRGFRWSWLYRAGIHEPVGLDKSFHHESGGDAVRVAGRGHDKFQPPVLSRASFTLTGRRKPPGARRRKLKKMAQTCVSADG